ncbi:MAG: metallophosphoesterase [Acidobacteriota bacterium]
MSHIATLLHISDLHLVQDLTEEGRPLWIKGPNTHSYAKLEAFSATVSEIKEIHKRQIDLVIVTGDVTTDGSAEALKAALEFIEAEDIYRYIPQRRVLGGLNAKTANRIVVPGNHDRYGGQYKPVPQQSGSILLEEVFGSSQRYPFAVAYRRSGTECEAGTLDAKTDSPAVIFFVIDSTLVQPGRRDFYNKVARGRIELGECSRIRELAAQIRATGETLDLNGNTVRVNYEASVRVALLHHHPVLPRELDEAGVSRFAKAVRKFKAGVTRMENSEPFIDACFDAGMNLVLFGHQHREYEVVLGRTDARFNLPHSIRFYCCPSTSEYSEQKNGFNLIDVYTDTVEVEYYRWSAVGTGSFALEGSTSFART